MAASGYVLYYGLRDPDRDRFKLILNCIMILTSGALLIVMMNESS